jgi:hypothetical protein
MTTDTAAIESLHTLDVSDDIREVATEFLENEPDQPRSGPAARAAYLEMIAELTSALERL